MTFEHARTELLSILQEWEVGKVHGWEVKDASETLEDTLRSTNLIQPGQEPLSGVAALVDAALGVLSHGDLELLLPDDLPRLRQLLHTPSGQEEGSARRFRALWQTLYNEPGRENSAKEYWYGTPKP